jgi:hypothetical protein
MAVAKNFLAAWEMTQLQRLISAYLDVAENGRPSASKIQNAVYTEY